MKIQGTVTKVVRGLGYKVKRVKGCLGDEKCRGIRVQLVLMRTKRLMRCRDKRRVRRPKDEI